jgi:hypothetical protein
MNSKQIQCDSDVGDEMQLREMTVMEMRIETRKSNFFC